MNIYKKAAITNLRFASSRGALTIEDLFELPLTGKFSLDTVSRTVLKAKSEVKGESLVVDTRPTQAESANALREEILKDIIVDKREERNATLRKAEKAAEKQRLLEALDRSENAELNNKSPEELRAMLKDID